jgi:ABC-type phosphate transport system substrate-binding protein
MVRFVVFLILAFAISARAEDLVVIVNAENPVTEASPAEIRDYFLKRKRTWPDKSDVRFIDRTPADSLRKLFLTNIINKTSRDLELFWIGQKLYSGDSAPLQEADEKMVIDFVGTFKGAIGYISSTTALTSKKVKALRVP